MLRQVLSCTVMKCVQKEKVKERPSIVRHLSRPWSMWRLHRIYWKQRTCVQWPSVGQWMVTCFWNGLWCMRRERESLLHGDYVAVWPRASCGASLCIHPLRANGDNSNDDKIGRTEWGGGTQWAVSKKHSLSFLIIPPQLKHLTILTKRIAGKA